MSLGREQDSKVGGTCGIFLAHANEKTGAGEWQFQSLCIGTQFDPIGVEG
jgi:hypothetical protein